MLRGYWFPFIVSLSLKISIFSAEAFYTSSRVHKLLLSREKRMALGANFNPDVLFGRARLHYIAARAPNLRLRILWMYIFLHV